jgi:cytochrome c-type biogenesis protein CcmE
LIIFIAIGYLIYTGFQGSTTYYYSVSEILAQGNAIYGEDVRVNGIVAGDSIEKEPGAFNKISFTVVEGEKSLAVTYNGVVPDAFKGGNEVVLEGQLDSDSVFKADTIITKCPSKYEPQE